MNIKDTLKKVRELIPHILAILAVIAGGGSLSYSSDNESDRQTVSHHQGQAVADNTLELNSLERRLKRLERHH